MDPVLTVDLNKIRHNAECLCQLGARHGVDIWAVTKVLCGNPHLGQALLEAGVMTLADSRLANLRRLRAAGVGGKKVLLRLPSPRRAEAVVNLADISLNSELTTLRALSAAALQAGREHAVLLMVDLGDLREGIWPDDLLEVAREAALLPGLQLIGLGSNLTCYGGVIPDEKNLGTLVDLARQLEQAGVMRCQVISGGNSSSLSLMLEGCLPAGINNLRLGESIILGRETIARRPLPGLHTDAVTLQAEVIEVKDKPSVPIGEIGQDAFGRTPVFADRGWQRRAILAVGQQDVDPEGLIPLEPGLQVLGASSDHLLLDTTDYPGEVQVGQIISFGLTYAALLRASTSAYVEEAYR